MDSLRTRLTVDRRLKSALRACVAALLGAYLVTLALATYFVGLADGREGVEARFMSGLPQFLHAALGLVLSIVLSVIALRARPHRPRSAVIIAASLVAGWLGWIAGNAVAEFEGPSVEYTGSLRIEAGSNGHRSIPIVCYSVIGDPTELSGLSAESFNLGLKDSVTRAPQLGVAGTTDIGGAPIFLVHVDDVSLDGLRGRATVSSVVFPASGGLGSSTKVSVEWTCDPATRGAPR